MNNRRITKKVRGVFERPVGSGVWWIQYFDSERRRRREKAGSKSNAIDLYTKRKGQALTGKKLPEKLRKKAVTLRDIGNAALEYSRYQKPRSAKDAECRMARILAQFGDCVAEAIKREDFERWLNDAGEEREWSLATKNRYIALLKLTYRLAEENDKVANNPARKLHMPKENNDRVRYLNQYTPLPTKIEYLRDVKDEEGRLRAVIQREYSYHLPEFEIALHTGMRRSEQYRLAWRDVDFAHRMLTIPQSKNGEARYLRLNSVALSMFEFLQSRTAGNERVFLSMRTDAPLTKNRHWFEDAVRQAGLKDFTWHCLRHTFASRLVMAGVDLRTVQELMGHKTIQMTCRYSHVTQDHQLAALERLVTAQPTATRSATEGFVQSERAVIIVN
jgi:site-specific recombinase XerD